MITSILSCPLDFVYYCQLNELSYIAELVCVHRCAVLGAVRFECLSTGTGNHGTFVADLVMYSGPLPITVA